MKKVLTILMTALLTIACGNEKKAKETTANDRTELLPDPEGKVKDHEVEALHKEHPGLTKYAGLYHFGESEGESELRIHFSKGIWSVQKNWAVMDMETGGFKPQYHNLRDVNIDVDGNFSATDIDENGASIVRKGEFVPALDHEGNDAFSLKIDNPWSYVYEEGAAESSLKIAIDPKEIYAGAYPESSFRVLEESDLEQLSKENLQIMQNEILARYSFSFEEGSAMATHFKQVKWHRPLFDNVDTFLNPIEKANIELIKKAALKK